MRFYNYNPFSVDINKLEGKHLALLKDVSEGWYIDYKREILELKKISKHLSSFANQYGGWLFFGIDESEDRKAGKFTGLQSDLIDSYLLRIREAATAHVNPNVYYEEKVIRGPIKEIGLNENRSIIVVYIPEGSNPPYIDSTGKIYRRLADQSFPTFEKDRYVLDRLWEKGNKNWERTVNFINTRPGIGKSYDRPVIYVHIMSNPRFNRKFDRIDFNSFQSIFKGVDPNFSIPMDSIHASQGGFIAKQAKHNDPLNLILSLRWWHNGNDTH